MERGLPSYGRGFPNLPLGHPTPLGVVTHTAAQMGSTSRFLRNLPYGKQQKQHPLEPVLLCLTHELTEHPFEGTVKAFHQAIVLGVATRETHQMAWSTSFLNLQGSTSLGP